MVGHVGVLVGIESHVYCWLLHQLPAQVSYSWFIGVNSIVLLLTTLTLTIHASWMSSVMFRECGLHNCHSTVYSVLQVLFTFALAFSVHQWKTRLAGCSSLSLTWRISITRQRMTTSASSLWTLRARTWTWSRRLERAVFQGGSSVRRKQPRNMTCNAPFDVCVLIF